MQSKHDIEITPLLASLQDVCKAPANRGKESPAASFSDDFNLSAPTSFESSHPYSLSSLFFIRGPS